MSDRPQPYSGTLELTWTNKHLRLLAEEDGAYQWVPPSDYRVAEVRLLEDAGAVGKTRSQRDRAKDNLLIRGDALNALTSLGELPEFYGELVGKVRLAYIDPPFNTKQSFLHYDDNLEHSVWLTMIRDRLVQIKKLLAKDGSVWVHLDDSEMAYCRAVMDEEFGRDSFVATIVWEKSYTRENRTDISTTHDYILVYAMNRSAWKDVRNLLRPSDAQVGRYSNQDNDPRGPWKAVPVHAKAEKGRRAEQFYEITLPSGRQVNPPGGRCWLYTRPRFDEMVADGRVWFGKDGNAMPAIKKFLSEVQAGLVPVTIWPHSEVGTTGTAKSEMIGLDADRPPFSTPKPEQLLERILHIASNPGDLVLDCFVGSGTTAAVAHKMGRRWIGIERSVDTFDNYVIPRLTKVVNGEDPGGITEQAGWTGGGGFRVLDVAPSMFDEDEGTVYLAAWATSSRLAEVCAAQMHYTFEPEPPFAGRRGRTRLAVIDGLVNEDVVRLLVANLPDDERLVVCGTAVDPAARTRLRELRHGSSVRKIPASILQDYRQSRWVMPATDVTPEANGSVPVTDEVSETPTKTS
jgi:adenine-specific DNA-methyltransferase